MNNKCCICGKDLDKDCLAANKKFISKSIVNFMCLECLADYLGTDVESILDKIKKFKEEGCVLFL